MKHWWNIGVKLKHEKRIKWLNIIRYGFVYDRYSGSHYIFDADKPRHSAKRITAAIIDILVSSNSLHCEVEKVYIQRDTIEKEALIDIKKLNNKREYIKRISEILSNCIHISKDVNFIIDNIINLDLNYKGRTLISCKTQAHQYVYNTQHEKEKATRVFCMYIGDMGCYNIILSNIKVDPMLLKLSNGDDYNVLGYL